MHDWDFDIMLMGTAENTLKELEEYIRYTKNTVCGNSGKVVVSVLVMELVEYNFL